MGTPAYLAPEQIQGQPQDSRSDQFALGIVLYQMLTGARPFDGSSLGAVCAQILNADPEPPSRRNPAVPKALDSVVARCLAKNPADRFASCDELAAALYPLARASTQSRASQVRKKSWWSKPSGQKDVWLVTAACLLLALCVPAIRSVRARLTVPQPPASLRFTSAPPPEAFLYASQTATGDPQPDAAGTSSPETAQKISPKGANRSAKRAPAKRPGELKNSPSETFFAALPSLPLVSTPAAQAAPSSGLQIEITSAVNEGTLTVFADRELLFSADLATQKQGRPMHFEHALPPGPHQFRVALYKPDRSLQLEKEGFAETRGDGANTLAVRVTRRAKLLVRRELALEVIWPGALAPAAEHASGTTGAVKSAALVN